LKTKVISSEGNHYTKTTNLNNYKLSAVWQGKRTEKENINALQAEILNIYLNKNLVSGKQKEST
jgi:hypothetical protein